MRKTTHIKSLGVLALLSLSSAFVSAEPIKFKYADVVDVGNSLAIVADGSVDQVVEVANDQGGIVKKIAKIPFAYSAKVRFALVRNITTIRAELAKLEEVRKGFVTQTGVKNGATMEDPARVKYEALWDAAKAEPITLDLTKLTEADLNLEKNQIPGTTLTFLAPLINELAPALAPPATQVAKK